MEKHQHVRRTFDDTAAVYDQQRRKLIPCFDDFYGVASALAEVETETPSILDLGAGTGLLSSFLLARYPKAKLTLIDLSDKMLAVAKLRLEEMESSGVTYLCEDYTAYVPGEAFDIIVSGLSIHHLSDADKLTLYRNSFANLKPGGVFINADQVLGHTPFVDTLYKEDWRGKVEASGLSEPEIAAAYERTKLDRMTDLPTQLGWLKDAGFSDVDCVYKYYNFAVMYGRKL
ncbi:class I SAM-dependent methyltransferase [Paenibacillus lignilyticus]|uniref:Class I SAM-dependent methyltransferase n=1 Tax=Paenibacillus lignilyticus TaxID=1172615 RepID=A0ABS5CKT5_9BACL|nr:class I SAM-dependent methyltransferase [Paenibacillus lignilyticus]MBP3966478.1 class I SAM-dependent methyltransferase [Paenibacillus lignilyticus]